VPVKRLQRKPLDILGFLHVERALQMPNSVKTLKAISHWKLIAQDNCKEYSTVRYRRV